MKYRYSVIIPQRDSLDTLSRLMNSIPKRGDIEVILVDNSHIPIKKTDISTSRDFILLYSDSSRGAGGARNVGMEYASGEWLIFADSDDFFTTTAFQSFDKFVNADFDLVYFKVNSVYSDTLNPADRGDMFSGLVDGYLNGTIDETTVRLRYSVPWGKMIKRCLIEEHKIRFDEVIASNDVYFSTLVGYYANSFSASHDEVYSVTVRYGSLTKQRNYNVTRSRYLVFLRRNKFLKEHGLSHQQISVMVHIYHALSLGLSVIIEFLWMAFKFRQNIFVGASNWFNTMKVISKEDKRDRKYFSK